MVLELLRKGVKQLGSDLAGGLNLLSTGFQKPLTTISTLVTNPKAIPELVKKTTSQPLKTQITSTLITTGLTATALLSGGAGLIPKTALGKTALIVGIGAVTTSPTISSIIEPSSNIQKAFSGGQILGKVVEGKETGLTTKQALTTGGVVGAAAVIGGLVAGKVIKEKAGNLIEKANTITSMTPITPLIPQVIEDIPAGVPEIDTASTSVGTPAAYNPQINVRVTPKNYLNNNNLIQIVRR